MARHHTRHATCESRTTAADGPGQLRRAAAVDTNGALGALLPTPHIYTPCAPTKGLASCKVARQEIHIESASLAVVVCVHGGAHVGSHAATVRPRTTRALMAPSRNKCNRRRRAWGSIFVTARFRSGMLRWQGSTTHQKSKMLGHECGDLAKCRRKGSARTPACAGLQRVSAAQLQRRNCM